MVVGKSTEWLPPGFIEKVKYKNGRKIKYYLNVETGSKYNSKKDVVNATVDNCVIVTPPKENGDYNVLSSDDKVDAISVKRNDSPAWLPDGWKIEEKIRHSGSSRGSVYKIYIDLSRGRKFYSKAAVIRYLRTPDHANTMIAQNEVDNVEIEPNVNKPHVDQPNVDEPSVDGPNENDSIVDVPSVDMSPQPVSISNTGGTNKKKSKRNSFVVVAIESTTDDDLPPGWIKEIKISRAGNRIRKDPYITDPVSGYIFRSKPDALRFLKTNDISKCACKPLRKVLDDVKLIENEIPSSIAANEELSVHNGGELNGGEASLDSVGVNSAFEEKISCENAEKINNSDPADVASTLPTTDFSTKEQLLESGKRAKAGPSKSKKRKVVSLPSRSSKRLAGSQPEMGPISDVNERSLRAAAREPASEVDKSLIKDSDTKSKPSDVGPTKEAKEQAFIGVETCQDPRMVIENLFNEVEKPSDVRPTEEAEEQEFIGEETHQDPLMVIENLFNDVEEPPTEGPTTQEEQLGGEKQIDESKQLEESQLCYDFGDSWSDPLEFAFKTLRGDISIDDTLTFPSCFSDQTGIPYSDDGCSKQAQPDASFQHEFTSHSGSSKAQSGAVDYLPTNSSTFSALGNIGRTSFGGQNCQSSAEVGKKDPQTKLNP